MLSDEITSQNSPTEESAPPVSPQAPTEQAPENTGISEPFDSAPEAPESSPNDFEAESNNIPSTPEAEKVPENKGENEPSPEPVSGPEQSPEPETAQIPVNEPLEPEHLKEEPEHEPEKPKISYLKSQKLEGLLVMARNAIQFRKKKKLEKIMVLFAKKKNITNDEVEKLLHVSDATATRYLSQLEKEGKVKQEGKTGKGVSYSKI